MNGSSVQVWSALLLQDLSSESIRVRRINLISFLIPALHISWLMKLNKINISNVIRRCFRQVEKNEVVILVVPAQHFLGVKCKACQQPSAQWFSRKPNKRSMRSIEASLYTICHCGLTGSIVLSAPCSHRGWDVLSNENYDFSNIQAAGWCMIMIMIIVVKMTNTAVCFLILYCQIYIYMACNTYIWIRSRCKRHWVFEPDDICRFCSPCLSLHMGELVSNTTTHLSY